MYRKVPFRNFQNFRNPQIIALRKETATYIFHLSALNFYLGPKENGKPWIYRSSLETQLTSGNIMLNGITQKTQQDPMKQSNDSKIYLQLSRAPIVISLGISSISLRIFRQCYVVYYYLFIFYLIFDGRNFRTPDN